MTDLDSWSAVSKILESAEVLIKEYRKIFESGSEEAKVVALGDLLVIFGAMLESLIHEARRKGMEFGASG